VYVKGKMRPVTMIPGMGGKGNEGEWWRGKFKYDTYAIV
jgi:hypothetical protein